MEQDQILAFKAKDGSLHEDHLDYEIRNAEIDYKEKTRLVAGYMQDVSPWYKDGVNDMSRGPDQSMAEHFMPMLENALNCNSSAVRRMVEVYEHLKKLRDLKRQRIAESEAAT